MNTQIAFIGCGPMNEAILAGLLNTGFDPAHLVVTVRRPERADELAKRYPGVQVLATQNSPDSNQRAVVGAETVVLGVEPSTTADLCREISTALSPGTIVVSVAAAVTVAQLEAALPKTQPVVRTLPNTPLRLGRGIVALSAGTHSTPDDLTNAKEVFRGAGTLVEVPEDHLNAVSAISGSGPAYVYYLAEAMAAAGTELGLDPELANVLARETVAGAGLILGEPGADATALRKSMAGPNSITVRALTVFDQRHAPGIVAEGARATVERSAEITQQLDNPAAHK
ncbi:pyrroline-5-carboxylate reductase [Arthrobacter sp. NQ7]|uniref:pyrroline-5-carboxylate reductase n=1 Tax=Arthrobacter sp. NQ7 TaxID=3032303 RepID=UPI00240F750B|nr:pyrroline-5-carboxylate reductase [Arthrobacter sp. NQ7]MDJ0459857.1 pyrroline-5-carboxylate reductase [Arthrobacter sp. NQ7]